MMGPNCKKKFRRIKFKTYNLLDRRLDVALLSAENRLMIQEDG